MLIRLLLADFSEDDDIQLLERLRISPHPFWSSLTELIDTASASERDQYFSVSGLEHLEAAQQAGRGAIIITYHSTLNRLAIAALPSRLDSTYIPTISQKLAYGKRGGRATFSPDQAARVAGITLEGQNLLAQGRIVQFVSDNEYAEMGIPVTLAGRVYHLRPGFAELALNSGATIVPQYTNLQPDGRIHTVFLPQLLPGDGNRDIQVRNLLNQYAAFINSCWRIAPESLRWSRLRSHFRQPRAD